jgi:4-hydroxyacetophenone monooxygenase
MGCMKALIERDKRALECREEVHDAFNQRLDARLAQMVWSHPDMSSWYKNSRGHVTTTSPWRLVDYWGWTREPDLGDYHLT